MRLARARVMRSCVRCKPVVHVRCGGWLSVYVVCRPHNNNYDRRAMVVARYCIELACIATQRHSSNECIHIFANTVPNQLYTSAQPPRAHTHNQFPFHFRKCSFSMQPPATEHMHIGTFASIADSKFNDKNKCARFGHFLAQTLTRGAASTYPFLFRTSSGSSRIDRHKLHLLVSNWMQLARWSWWYKSPASRAYDLWVSTYPHTHAMRVFREYILLQFSQRNEMVD